MSADDGSKLPAEQWEKVKVLFAEAEALAPADRQAFLVTRCGDDSALRDFVEQLLRSHDQMGSFQQFPAIDLLPAEIWGRLPTVTEAPPPSKLSTFEDSSPMRTFSEGELVADRYRILRFVGVGGMGEVYEVEDGELRDGVSLALKTIRPGFAEDEGTLRREIRAGWNVTHRNVCRLHHLGSHRRSQAGGVGSEEVQFLVMEFLAGETLSRRIRRKRLSQAEALPIVTQIAAGLDAAHDAGIIHGDLKSANVMLVPDLREGIRTVITDFGLARFSGEPAHLHVAGTVDYMAPEQLRGGSSTPAADIYAFGVVLYEMLTQTRPFDGGWVDTSAPSPPSPRIRAPDLDPMWERVILRALERDPAARFARAGEVVVALSGRTGRQKSALALGLASFATVATLLFGMLAYTILHAPENPASTTSGRVYRSNGGRSASIALDSRPRLAVLGFRNLTGRSDAAWLSTALSEVFRTELAADDKLVSVSGEDVTRMKRELSLADDGGTLSNETLARVRRNSGADIVLLGSYVSLEKETGGRIRVDLRLQDTNSGTTIAFVSETGMEATLFDLVSRAGTILRSKLGLGELPPAEVGAVARTIPRSLDAQRLYSEGLEQLRLMRLTSARDLFQQAIRSEPSYAMSHASLADAWAALGYEALAKEEARTALSLSEGLDPENRLSIEAKYYEWAQEHDRAAEIYKKLCDFAPENLEHRLSLAKAQTSGGRGDEALLTLQDARKLPAPLSEDPRLDLTEAAAAESLGEFSRAQDAAARAAERGGGRDAPLLVARAQLRQAWAFYRMGQPETAIEKAEQARKTFARFGDRGGQAQAIKNLADVIDDQGNHDEAERLYGIALGIFREIGQMNGVIVTLNNLAYTYKSKGDLTAAKKTFEESLALSREVADQARTALVLNGIGIIHWRQGELAAAGRIFEEALRIHRARGDKSKAEMVQNNLGLVLLDLGDLDAAEPYLNDALQIARGAEDRRSVALTLSNIGVLFLLRGDLTEATKRFQESLSIGRAIPDASQIANALYGLGYVLFAAGDLEGARANHEEALALRSGAGEKGLAAESRVALAELELEEGDSATAALAAQEAADEFRRENELELEAGANAVLARALVLQKQYQPAHEAVRRATTVLANNENPAARLSVSLAGAHVRAATGQVAEAKKDFEAISKDAHQYGFVGYRLEAALARAELELESDGPSARDRLAAVESEARAKGFGLVARKAVSALRADARPPL